MVPPFVIATNLHLLESTAQKMKVATDIVAGALTQAVSTFQLLREPIHSSMTKYSRCGLDRYRNESSYSHDRWIRGFQWKEIPF